MACRSRLREGSSGTGHRREPVLTTSTSFHRGPEGARGILKSTHRTWSSWLRPGSFDSVLVRSELLSASAWRQRVAAPTRFIGSAPVRRRQSAAMPSVMTVIPHHVVEMAAVTARESQGDEISHRFGFAQVREGAPIRQVGFVAPPDAPCATSPMIAASSCGRDHIGQWLVGRSTQVTLRSSASRRRTRSPP